MADAKRPWHGAETRLGVKIGLTNFPGRGAETGIGWALLRLRPPILREGEIDVPAPAVPELVELTGAEFRTLREDCGLSLAEAAAFHEVRERTVKKWERDGPTEGAAAELTVLRARIEAAAETALEAYLTALSEGDDVQGADLYRYEAWSYPDSRPAAEGLPHGAHNRLISRTADLLASEGIPVSIVYWSPDTAMWQPERD